MRPEHNELISGKSLVARCELGRGLGVIGVGLWTLALSDTECHSRSPSLLLGSAQEIRLPSPGAKRTQQRQGLLLIAPLTLPLKVHRTRAGVTNFFQRHSDQAADLLGITGPQPPLEAAILFFALCSKQASARKSRDKWKDPRACCKFHSICSSSILYAAQLSKPTRWAPTGMPMRSHRRTSPASFCFLLS